jgi:hypothetical protein
MQAPEKLIKQGKSDALTHIRVGALVQRGCRQSIPSHSIAICAGVSEILPSVAFGQGKYPRSSTL